MAYGEEFERRRPWRGGRGRGWMGPWGRRPGRPAHGYPVRGFHTYDLDYGRQAGGPDTEYSGRAGWPTGGPEQPTPPLPRGAWAYGAWYGYGPLWRRRRAPWFEERYGPEEPPSFARRARGRYGSRRRWP